jgi:L-threonylcarbamoyladenylate synthase
MKRNKSVKSSQVLHLRLKANQDIALKKAAALLRGGDLVAYPTETFYGLGADISCPEALEKVFYIKGRDRSKPLQVCVDHPKRLEELVEHISEEARRLMDHFWPGALTLLLPARGGLNPALTGGRGRIGVRVPGHPVARELTARVGNPITATSANRSGMPGHVHWERVVKELGEDLQLVIAWPEILPGVGSTIIDLCEKEPRVVREGIVPLKEIQAVLGRPFKG